jgi:uncharacterized membrane protein
MSMRWNIWYRVKSYVRSSLWITPFIAMLLELVAIRISHWIDAWLGWTFLGLSVTGAQATLQAIVTAQLSFIVFTFGSLLVAIQVASAQLTPRIIATTLLRDRVVQYTVGLFIFTLLFSLSAQNRIDTQVHEFTLFLASLLGILCFGAFFYLIDYASRLLRPISVLSHLGNTGIAVIESVYPDASLGPDAPEPRRLRLGTPDRVLRHRGISGIVLAVNVNTLINEAERLDGIIEFEPQVGDFVAVDEPLFNLHGGARAIDDDTLLGTVAFGSERTLEQDPTFAFRIIIDIALRALSAAINDPTTAVLALDQLHRLLRMVGKRHLRTDEITTPSGNLRVVFRTPNWEDFVHLAFSEIRACGSSNLQIVRRLRAMIENLVQTLPVHRHPALLRELDLLDREITKRFAYEEELALARVPDTQGLGGHSGRNPAT